MVNNELCTNKRRGRKRCLYKTVRPLSCGRRGVLKMTPERKCTGAVQYHSLVALKRRRPVVLTKHYEGQR